MVQEQYAPYREMEVHTAEQKRWCKTAVVLDIDEDGNFVTRPVTPADIRL